MFGTKELTEKLEASQKLNGKLEKELSDLRDAESKIKKEYEVKEKQVMAMMEIEKKEAILEEKGKLQEDFNKKLSAELQANFDKLSTSLESMHKDGNATTKYIQELSMKVIDKVTPNGSKPLLSNESEY